MHIALIWCVSEFISVTGLAARWFGTQTIKLVVVISGEVNDDILQTTIHATWNRHSASHCIMWNTWKCCGSRFVQIGVGLWVLWVRHTPLEYLHQLSDSMPKRMRMVLEANGNPLKYYLVVRLNCKTVLNPEIKYICINISFYIDLKVKGTG